jgi:NAD(P)-dependent dehydrogenase (short-subunit alcohol dehydrogenase family)
MRLGGKNAIISGAGSGIGRAIAIGFAAEGAGVVAADIIADRARSVAAEIRGAGGKRLDREKLHERIPMHRAARPEEMVGAAVFLASDEASYVTGSTVLVDGGYLAV